MAQTNEPPLFAGLSQERTRCQEIVIVSFDCDPLMTALGEKSPVSAGAMQRQHVPAQ